ncbi:hypothetical protein AV530_010192 [Patagioenas fasciata monilis]|uniref:Uncharacterized protein n=1 Tax=Patagioenas fasciata monilis TaxID=372326 RepID=A0A1V4JH71_PATFA|nr:hypothetical protein AV530_010192 [Patagioenas fasciata monilis]
MDTQESMSTQKLMDSQELMDTQEPMSTQKVMDTQESMSTQELMDTQELMGTQESTGIQVSMSTQKLMDTPELMGTQESMDTQEPRAAPAPALLMPRHLAPCPWQQPGCHHQQKTLFVPTPAAIPSITRAPRTPNPTASHTRRVLSPNTAATGEAGSWWGEAPRTSPGTLTSHVTSQQGKR